LNFHGTLGSFWDSWDLVGVISVGYWDTLEELLGGFKHGFYDFPYIWNFIIPIDFHIFQRGGTANQRMLEMGNIFGMKKGSTSRKKQNWMRSSLDLMDIYWRSNVK